MLSYFNYKTITSVVALVANNRISTMFNSINDVSRSVIAPHLSADDLEVLMKASWSTRQIFKDEFMLRKHANILLLDVMSANRINVMASLERFSAIYGDEVWKLLLARTRGVEKRGRRWESISVIEFAVYAGDFSDNPEHGYLLNNLLAVFPIEHRHYAIAQVQQFKLHGAEQYGEKRWLLSALTDLLSSYTRFESGDEKRNWNKSKEYWDEHVVPDQKNLPENILCEFFRRISWAPADMPDFKNLPAPKPVPKKGSIRFLRFDKELFGAKSMSIHLFFIV